MKQKIFIAAAMLLLPIWLSAQFKIYGKVSDRESGAPLPHAHITIEKTHISVFSDMQGKFAIKNLQAGSYTLTCSYMGYTTFNSEINLNNDFEVSILMEYASTLSDEVIIRATRSSETAPITQTNINKKAIEHLNLGQDLPILLKTTPSVIFTSDAGTGIGYTGINIRGSDPTRINITINGIPMNDSESHSVYWVNIPDIVSSVENIQIQRGVGTSTNGAASFGASINLQTNALNDKPYAELSNSIGSFNTIKNTIRMGTGLLSNKWAFDARMSQISTDGYIDRAFSNLNSYYLSAGYYGHKNIVKFIHFSGKEKTYQAWYGAPKDSLKTNRTFNPAGLYYDNNGAIQYYDNETDNYQQDYYQIHYSHQLNRNITFNAAAHLTYGRGYYEQFKQQEKFSKYELPNVIIGNDTIKKTNLIRQRWLDNYFYGTTYSLNYNSFSNLSLILGGAYNIYDGVHFGEIIWADISQNINKGHRYYENNAYKTDLNNFIKLNYALNKFNFMGDLQYRHITYDFLGKAIISNNIEDLQQYAVYNFINPKAGVTYQINHQNNIYGFWGIANREPVRDDFTSSTSQSRPLHETLNNIELGYKRNHKKYTFGLNTYLMLYKNQLVLTGEINDVGDYTRKNIDGSYRRGLEVECSYEISEMFSVALNFTYSQNKIKDYTEHYDVYDENWEWTGNQSINYKNTNISFSPEIIAGGILNIKPISNLNISLLNKYVGHQYIDNTSNKNRMLAPYFVSDINLSYFIGLQKIKGIELVLMVNNLSNCMYVSNAWVYNGIINNGAPIALSDGYFPQAGRHFLGGINFKF